MPTYTPRLGLEIPLLDENLNDLPNNWQKLDRGFSGVTWVTPGTIPDNSVMFDGMLIAELGNGIVWKAKRNQAGGFDKVYIKYPWVFSVTTTAPWSPQGTTHLEYGLYDFDAANSVNADAGNLSGGRLKLPFKGLYEWNCYFRWENDGNIAQRSVAIMYDGSVDYANTEVIRPASNFQVMLSMSIRYVNIYNAGVGLSLGIWKDSSGTSQTKAHFTIALLRMLP